MTRLTQIGNPPNSENRTLDAWLIRLRTALTEIQNKFTGADSDSDGVVSDDSIEVLEYGLGYDEQAPRDWTAENAPNSNGAFVSLTEGNGTVWAPTRIPPGYQIDNVTVYGRNEGAGRPLLIALVELDDEYASDTTTVTTRTSPENTDFSWTKSLAGFGLPRPVTAGKQLVIFIQTTDGSSNETNIYKIVWEGSPVGS